MTYLKQLQGINTEAKLNEEDAQSLARVFTVYLKALKTDGYSRCTPGRFLQPGDLENVTILTFAPLHSRDKVDKESLYKKFRTYLPKCQGIETSCQDLLLSVISWISIWS